MTDEQTAAAIVSEHRKSQHLTITEAYKELKAAIVRALQAARESALDTHANAAVLRMCHEARMMNGIVDYSDPNAVGVVRKVLGTFNMTKDGAVVAGNVELWHPQYPKVGKVGTWLANGGTCRFYFPTASGIMNTWNDVPIAECYSTREAAEAAKEGKA